MVDNFARNNYWSSTEYNNNNAWKQNFNNGNQNIRDKFEMKFSPVGVLFSDQKADVDSSKKGNGGTCIAPLIFNCAKGATIAFDSISVVKPCASFYLGYSDWIRPGIENALSNKGLGNRQPERFIKSPEMARSFLESNIPIEKRTKNQI